MHLYSSTSKRERRMVYYNKYAYYNKVLMLSSHHVTSFFNYYNLLVIIIIFFTSVYTYMHGLVNSPEFHLTIQGYAILTFNTFSPFLRFLPFSFTPGLPNHCILLPSHNLHYESHIPTIFSFDSSPHLTQI